MLPCGGSEDSCACSSLRVGDELLRGPAGGGGGDVSRRSNSSSMNASGPPTMLMASSLASQRFAAAAAGIRAPFRRLRARSSRAEPRHCGGATIATQRITWPCRGEPLQRSRTCGSKWSSRSRKKRRGGKRRDRRGERESQGEEKDARSNRRESSSSRQGAGHGVAGEGNAAPRIHRPVSLRPPARTRLGGLAWRRWRRRTY